MEDLGLEDSSSSGAPATVAEYAYDGLNYRVVKKTYDAYGKATELNPDFTAYTGTDHAWEYLFTGRRLCPFGKRA